MRFSWAALATVLVTGVVATGERGAAERALFWYAYVADKEQGGNKVAPDCGLKMTGDASKKCNLDQFLEFLWKKGPKNNKKDSERPKVNLQGIDKDFSPDGKVDIKDLYNSIFSFRDESHTETYVDKKDGLTKTRTVSLDIMTHLDAKNLYPSASDWYDAVAKVTTPLRELREKIDARPDKKPTDAEKKLLERADKAAELTVQLRWKDAENYRIKFFRESLPFGDASKADKRPPGLKTYNVKPIAGSNYQRIDIKATKIYYMTNHKDVDIKKELKDLNRQHWKKDINKDHLRAIKSVEKARTAMLCPI
ncbi:hypothetical protein B0H66DRAFT_43776 [Apodospora peruviana]|uniref:Uncharacterized protein n=1 Tax=Apodospora peruviana TaxID=516989 RepID=A0AAE0MGE6_9PEZI|nr:hypothetical protein B0H66DRAFT_43776 [Apodospora peruviana]